MGYKGCKNCQSAPKTYEEFCIVKNRVKHGEHDKLIECGLCPDAFSDVSPLCGAYDAGEENENSVHGGKRCK